MTNRIRLGFIGANGDGDSRFWAEATLVKFINLIHQEQVTGGEGGWLDRRVVAP